MTKDSRVMQGGFTLIELVLVVVLLGLLAATALPRFLDLTDDAQAATIEGASGGFSTGVMIAHAQWMGEGFGRGAPTTSADKIGVNLDGKIVYMNEFGWPAGTDASTDAAANSMTAAECQEVFAGILQSPPITTINRNDRKSARFQVTLLDQQGGDDAGNVGDVCRYELIVNSDASATATHYFDYDLVDGEVVVIRPTLN